MRKSIMTAFILAVFSFGIVCWADGQPCEVVQKNATHPDPIRTSDVKSGERGKYAYFIMEKYKKDDEPNTPEHTRIVVVRSNQWPLSDDQLLKVVETNTVQPAASRSSCTFVQSSAGCGPGISTISGPQNSQDLNNSDQLVQEKINSLCGEAPPTAWNSNSNRAVIR
jgi:hypothetical protein